MPLPGCICAIACLFEELPHCSAQPRGFVPEILDLSRSQAVSDPWALLQVIREVYHPNTFRNNPQLVRAEWLAWSQNAPWVVQSLASQVLLSGCKWGIKPGIKPASVWEAQGQTEVLLAACISRACQAPAIARSALLGLCSCLAMEDSQPAQQQSSSCMAQTTAGNRPDLAVYAMQM